MRSSIFRVLAASASLSTSPWPISYGPETRTSTCTIAQTDPNTDDWPAIDAAFKKCQKNSVIVFSKGVTYNLYSPLQALDLSNVEIQIKGNIQLPTDVADIQNKVAANANATAGTSWIYITGDSVAIYGSKDTAWGWFHGHGQHWWDMGIQLNRPRLATFKVTNGRLNDLKHYALIAWAWSIPGSNILVENFYLDNRPINGTRDTTISFPFNTDGINISGQNITVNHYHGYNGDDAISIVNEANNVTVKNVYAGFSSHGLSIGSLGKGGQVASVSNIHFENVFMDQAVYGARFKSWVGGSGLVENISYRNVQLNEVSTAVMITQNYYDQALGKPTTTGSTTSVQLSNFRFENFQGDLNPSFTDGTCISNPCWNFVEGMTNPPTQSIILDLYPGTAHDLVFKNFRVTPFQKTLADTTVICDPTTLDADDQKTLGFKCADGPFIAQ